MDAKTKRSLFFGLAVIFIFTIFLVYPIIYYVISDTAYTTEYPVIAYYPDSGTVLCIDNSSDILNLDVRPSNVYSGDNNTAIVYWKKEAYGYFEGMSYVNEYYKYETLIYVNSSVIDTKTT